MRTTGPGQSPLLLLDAVSILDRAGIHYAVVGAMAAAYHGAVRASVDADAVLFLKDESLATIEAGFRTAGFTALLRRGDPDDPIFSILALSDVHGNRVDLLAGIRGMDPAADGRTAKAVYEGVALRFIGLEDFVAMKLYAGSPIDVDDARRVMDVSRGMLDLALVRTLAARFGGDAPASLESLIHELNV